MSSQTPKRPSPFVFGVDLDGTCADFYGGLRPIAAEWLGVDVDSLTTEVSWNLPEWGVADAPGGGLLGGIRGSFLSRGLSLERRGIFLDE